MGEVLALVKKSGVVVDVGGVYWRRIGKGGKCDVLAV